MEKRTLDREPRQVRHHPRDIQSVTIQMSRGACYGSCPIKFFSIEDRVFRWCFDTPSVGVSGVNLHYTVRRHECISWACSPSNGMKTFDQRVGRTPGRTPGPATSSIGQIPAAGRRGRRPRTRGSAPLCVFDGATRPSLRAARLVSLLNNYGAPGRLQTGPL
jgi:hypothetical protein